MSIFEALVLGLVQGITEFLPVSSSAHLAILEHLWKLNPASCLPVTVMLHAATALAVVIFLAPVLARLVRGLWARDREQRKGSWLMVLYIVIATIPAGVAGMAFRHVAESAFSSPLLIGLMLLVTGGVLFGTRYTREGRPLTWWRALLVGVAQAVAVPLRGISRSGSTVASALYVGLERKAAFQFSFLLAIPAITGAFLMEVRKVDMAVLNPAALAGGMVAAFVAGLAALFVLGRIVAGRKLHWFAYYCWAAGLAVILFVR